MSEPQAEYITDALEMMGKGYDKPATTKCEACKGTGHIAYVTFFVPEKGEIEISVEHCEVCRGSGFLQTL